MARCASSDPPVARRDPVASNHHGHQRVDDYAWMHQDAPGLRDYLLTERQYYDRCTSPSRDLRQTLYAEMARRLAPTDESVRWRHGAWSYYTRTSETEQYEDLYRRPTAGGDEEVVLSSNDLSVGKDYFALGVREVSPDDRWLAYSVDTTGDEVFELRVRDLQTGQDLPDRIMRSYYGIAWSADSSQFLYVVHDDAYRPDRILLHRLGDETSHDVIAFEEPDQRFEVNVEATRSGEFAVITVISRDTSEAWLVPTADLSTPPRVVEPRRAGVEYAVDHLTGVAGGRLAIVTNHGAEEFRVVIAPTASPGRSNWDELLPSRAGERLLAVDAFDGYVVVTLRLDSRPALRILDLPSGAARDVTAGDATAIGLSARDDEHQPIRDPYDSESITVVTESLIDPPAWWSVTLATGERTMLRQQPVPNYDPSAYVTGRLTAIGADGESIPVTIARPRTPPDEQVPLLLYGYGAYESCIDPWFDPAVSCLLDQGVAFAIAHVRGGGERGRWWWQQGRLRNKPTTFDDFVAVADMLASEDWVDGQRVASRGLSAGGLLQGAAFSRAPQRWRAVVAEVPFVDVVTSMLDPATPLTVTEWDEWGDPRDPEDYAVMQSYSPYENPPAGTRPDLLVTGSLHDPRVMVREPAKWVARLRATQTDDSVLLFRAELGAAAHIGASGRLDRLRYEAEIVAFLLERFREPPR
jgi:oligopeptidase B